MPKAALDFSRLEGRLRCVYAEDAERAISLIRDRVSRFDPSTTLRRAAHTLKGSAIHFSAKYVQALAEELEEYGTKSAFVDAPAALTKLKYETDRLRDRIRSRYVD